MRFAVVVAALTTVGVLGAVPMTASAIPALPYYAAPSGSGTACTQASPCTLNTAITTSDNDPMGSERVDLESGTYKNVIVDLTEPITLQPDPADTTTPVLEGNGSVDVITVKSQATIAGLAIGDGLDGMLVATTGGATVTDSSFDDSDIDGIVDYSSSSSYSGVTADGNATDGIVISGESIGSTTIIESTASNNGDDGFAAIPVPNTNSTEVQITESTSYGNGAFGIDAGTGTLVVADATSVIANGQHSLYTSGGGEIEAGGDILAESTTNGSTDCEVGNPSTSNVGDEGYNISDDATCPISNAANSVPDSTTLDASLGTFDNYGGPAKTVPIALNSPAVTLVASKPTNGPDICGSTVMDERGLSRPTSYPCAAGSFDPNAAPDPSTVTLTAAPNQSSGAVVGDTITLTEHVTGDVGPASGGSAMFLMAPSGSVLATITTCNHDAITEIPVIDGVATCQIPASSAGSFHFGASFGGSSTYTFNLADPIDSYTVKDSTTTSLTVDSSTHLSVTVTPDASATSAPTGQISFLVGGLAPSGSPVDLVAGGSNTAAATLTLSPALTGPATVTAQYVGDGSFAPSSDTVTTKNPTLVAHVTSTGKKTKYGWYDAPVKFTWTCTAGSGTLLGACPAATTLSASKAKQSVKRTISNSVGGTVTVTSTAVNIDRVKPTIRITGVKKGHTYPKGTKLHPKCVAKDALSGLAGRCTLKITHTHFGGKTVYAAFASAKDKAGNGTRGGPYHWDIKTNK